MLNQTCKTSLLTIVTLALLLVCNVTKARAQGFELRCRGAKDSFSIKQIDRKTLSLTFNSSQSAANADGSGLTPGSCSWIDRLVNDDEPRLIQFRASAAAADV